MKPNTMRTVAIVMLAALVLSLSGLADHTIRGSQKETPHSKIDSVLAQLLQMAQGGGVSAQAVQQAASQAGIPIQGNSVIVVVETTSPASAVIAFISQLFGGIVRAHSRNFIELQVPLSSSPLNILLQLANLSGIAYIRPPLAPQALVISEGVAVSGASALHSNGLRGQGAKIAIIDLGFAGLSTAQARGELPTGVLSFDFTGTGLQSTTSHGTAVAEIIHDMAPDAQLLLMKIADEVDLENAVDEAIRRGVDIINHSIGWFNTNFYDGTGPIAAAVQRARSAGILWVNSAGNYALRHWQGFATDSDGDGWVEFAPGREGLQFTAQAGQTINLFLTWRDWPRSAQDYDLFVVNSFGAPVASSERLQSGTQPPTENLFFRAPTSGTYEVRVKAVSVTSPKQLAIFNLNQDISPSVAQGSIVAPADSSAALAVGAIHYLNWTTGPIQPFSSQGPTTDGRVKPDISGPDSVSVSTVGFNPFIGTSAAAPHVAGAAALLLSENPALSASGLESRLKGDAIPMGSPTQFGAGRLNLTAQVARRPDLIIVNPAFSPSNPRVGDTIFITAQLRNQGDANAGPFAVELRDSFGTLTQNLAGLAAGASVNISFTRQLQASSDTITLTVDPFNQVAESNETNNVAQLTVRAQTQPTLGIDVRTDRSSYMIGDTIRVEFTTNADGFVYIYDVDAQGLVTILYPRSEAANAFLRAGTYDLASLLGISRLVVAEPTGLEHVHGIIVSGAVNLGFHGQRSSSFTDPNLFRSVLSQRIQAINPALSWAWDAAAFQVISPQPTNQPPVARFTYTPSQPLVNQTVTFDGSSSYDPDGSIVDWHWIFEGTTRVEARGVRVNVRFTTARTYRVTLIVTDNQGTTGSLTQDVVVQERPTNQPPVARFTFSPTSPQVNELVTFDGRASSDPDGTIVSYRWDLNGDGQIDATGALVQARFSRAGTYTVTLTVIDNGGLSDSTSQTVQVGGAPPPPSPPPPLPDQFGFFIMGSEPNKLKIAVQGDPSWTSNRSFRILLQITEGGSFTSSPDAEEVGNASSSRARRNSSKEVFMRGTVRDGKVIYTMELNFARSILFFLEMDVDGDGDLERWPSAPAFLVIEDQIFRVEVPTENGVFFLVAERGSLLPFAADNIMVCNQPIRKAERQQCVPPRP